MRSEPGDPRMLMPAKRSWGVTKLLSLVFLTFAKTLRCLLLERALSFHHLTNIYRVLSIVQDTIPETADTKRTLWNPADCSPPGSSVHGILQARILESVVLSFSRGSSRPRDQTRVSRVSCIGRRVPSHLCHLGSPIRVTCC